jgi:hypothetical protein
MSSIASNHTVILNYILQETWKKLLLEYFNVLSGELLRETSVGVAGNRSDTALISSGTKGTAANTWTAVCRFRNVLNRYNMFLQTS